MNKWHRGSQCGKKKRKQTELIPTTNVGPKLREKNWADVEAAQLGRLSLCIYTAE